MDSLGNEQASGAGRARRRRKSRDARKSAVERAVERPANVAFFNGYMKERVRAMREQSSAPPVEG